MHGEQNIKILPLVTLASGDEAICTYYLTITLQFLIDSDHYSQSFSNYIINIHVPTPVL